MTVVWERIKNRIAYWMLRFWPSGRDKDEVRGEVLKLFKECLKTTPDERLRALDTTGWPYLDELKALGIDIAKEIEDERRKRQNM